MLRQIKANYLRTLPLLNIRSRMYVASGGAPSATTAVSEPKVETTNEFLTPVNTAVVDYDDPDYLPVPEYPVRPNEPLNIRKQRLLYQSRKRGMLENDLILSTFAARYLKNFNEEETIQYDQMINGISNDWDIYYWATGTKPTPPQYDTPIMKLLKQHVKNVENEPRIRQPDLEFD